MKLKTIIASAAVLVAFAVAAVSAQAAYLPLINAKGAAQTWQTQINQKWDPAGVCRTSTAYSFRCVYTQGDYRWVNTYTKVGPHRLRQTLTGNYGEIGPISQTVTLTKANPLYRYF